MIKRISAIDLLPYAWLIFLIGTCVSPRFKELNNIFYIAFIPLTLIAFQKYYSELFRAPVFIWLLTLSGWMALSSSWAANPDYSDLKAIGYVIIFIAGCSLMEEKKSITKWGFLIPIAIAIQLYLSIPFGQRLSGFGPMENPLYAGQFYLFFTWFFLFYQQFHTKPTLSTLIRWLGFIMSVTACCLTQSRSVVFCIPLIIIVFLLQQDFIHRHKKTVMVFSLLIGCSFLSIFVNHQWITLPSNQISYNIRLDTNEVVKVVYREATESKYSPAITTPKGIKSTLEKISNQKYFLFQANQAGNYRLDIPLDKTTINPWGLVKVYTKKSDSLFQLQDQFMPPRALQFELSFGFRTEIWPVRIKQCLEKPIVGHGFTQSSDIPFKGSFVNDSHNFFLGTFFHGGIIALVMYVGLLGICLYILCKNKLWGFAILLLCGIITTSFDDEKFFSSTRPYWLLLLFPIGKALNACLNKHRNFLTAQPSSTTPSNKASETS